MNVIDITEVHKDNIIIFSKYLKKKIKIDRLRISVFYKENKILVEDEIEKEGFFLIISEDKGNFYLKNVKTGKFISDRRGEKKKFKTEVLVE
jgi:hypothetical protein